MSDGCGWLGGIFGDTRDFELKIVILRIELRFVKLCKIVVLLAHAQGQTFPSAWAPGQ